MNVHTITGSQPLFMTVGQWILDNPDCVAIGIYYEHSLKALHVSISTTQYISDVLHNGNMVVNKEVYKAIIVYYTR
jgi:hypothetical protein